MKMTWSRRTRIMRVVDGIIGYAILVGIIAFCVAVLLGWIKL